MVSRVILYRHVYRQVCSDTLPSNVVVSINAENRVKLEETNKKNLIKKRRRIREKA